MKYNIGLCLVADRLIEYNVPISARHSLLVCVVFRL